ncbi:MAG TPA: response regulator, partial [Anaerolineales bacterium]|nr:response regulator [Anaerolineales bacterium]
MPPIRILLADDHAIVRAGIRRMIEEIPGLAVTKEVGNGPQIFDSLAKHPVDCLLIDITMPEFDPIPAIRNIRILYPDLKILVISAHDDNFYVQGLLRAGINGYHLKDQPLSELKLAIERVLAGERWLSGPLIDKLAEVQHGSPSIPLLTSRQRDLLQMLRDGKDNQSIAQDMGVSVKTIENHLTRLYKTLNVLSRLEAVNYAMRWPQVLGVTAQHATTVEAESQEADTLQILVVDDNRRYRGVLQNMLGKICPQATLYEAQNIQTAVQLAQAIKPHMILMDVVLGDEDGITCTRRVKAVSPHSRVILISAYPDREFHRLGLQAGAGAFLDK